MQIDDVLDEAYEYILHKYKNPEHKGKIEDADIVHEDGNPTCGDVVKLYIKTKDGKIVDAKFEGKGCTISQASADILIDLILGKKLDEVKGMTKEEFLNALGINLSPMRLKCALLSFKVFKMGAYGIKIDDSKVEEE